MKTATAQEKIEAFLQETLGWSADILGIKGVAKAVEQRRSSCGLPDLNAYFQQLQASPEEQSELVETLVVPETWFFRDEKLFTFLAQYLKAEALSCNRKTLRCLSIPCSSGEEPYSIAMMLFDLGMRSAQFQIDAIDLSRNNLSKAKVALYRRNSFRSRNLSFRDRYFTLSGDAYQLCDRVKNSVKFMQGNLLDPQLLVGQAPYDIILCRNVLIYFDANSQQRTLQTLERLLDDQGLLCLGGAESIQSLSSSFISIRDPVSFVYRKQATPPKEQKHRSLFDRKLNETVDRGAVFHWANRANTNPLPAKQNAQPSTASTPQVSMSDSSVSENKSLETARQLANQGRLKEAMEICETYLQQNSINVEAHLLLGQVYQGQGMEEKAAECFQKTIYLEPNHYQALVHLALLEEQKGNIAKAIALKQRIQRIEETYSAK